MLALLWLFLLVHESIIATEAQQFSAMFAFGDSLIDPGNNNNLHYSLARANYVPYGVDFDQGVPTGRFCNGKTIIDFLGDLLGLPMLPPYTAATGKDIIKGVNYASAAGGILDETGRYAGQIFSSNDQIASFRDTLNQLKAMMGKEENLRHYLDNSLVVMALGSNDYINNYLQPALYASSHIYSPQQYSNLLIKRYTRQILKVHSFGLKKFVLGGIGPLGCIPNQLATGHVQTGQCFSFSNDIVEMFNVKLRSLVDQLNRDYNGSIFVYGNSFGGLLDVIRNATRYGLNVTDKGCCGIGRNRGQLTCLPLSIPCANRNQYVFWDAYHPTQKVNQILARRAYSGTPSDCYPINIQQMANL